MRKMVYVVLVSPDVPRGYLGLQSDEEEPGAVPPRTADLDLAQHFDMLPAAEAALRDAAARYPSHAFCVEQVELRDKVRVDGLSGGLLHLWVARAEGRKLEYRVPIGQTKGYWFVANDAGDWMFELEHYRPSTEWAHGGPIIDREGIHIRPLERAIYRRVRCNGAASLTGEWGSFTFAPTMLIAAMRAYVASKFGAEVADEDL